MRKVIAFGTFDIFHEGHKSFLRQAGTHGDWLRVVVARDKKVLSVKKKLPKYNEEKRRLVVERSGLADEAVLGDLRGGYLAIKRYRPDVICIGYDQVADLDDLQKKLKEFGLEKTEIARLLPYKPEIFKSSMLRNK